LIPFTGFILDYPVAYVPTTAQQTTFLGGVPLDVYECAVTSVLTEGDHRPRRHSLMKFSCPQNLRLVESWLSPEMMMRKLEVLFRTERVMKKHDLVLDVAHHKETHDRVAL
jgi:hypothetical protein